MARFDTYGVASITSEGRDDVERAREEILVRGFTCIEAALSPREVADLNERMDSLYARQCDEVGGEVELIKINDADIVRCLLAYDDRYMNLATHPRMMAIVKSILGESFTILMQNGIINRPDRAQAQTRWHRDLNYQHWVNSKPIAVSALVCLEDFTHETGGTVFLPASQRFEDFPSQALAESIEAAPQVPAGSIILFDSMTFHRAGVNRSGRIRRGVNHVFGAPILSQQVDIPAMIGGEPPQDPWLAGFLGYRWNPVRDVTEWRLRKIARAS